MYSGPGLPRGLFGARIANLPNKLLLTGGLSDEVSDEVGGESVVQIFSKFHVG